jgi:hypothetical protein
MKLRMSARLKVLNDAEAKSSAISVLNGDKKRQATHQFFG